jgi:hypothetical protein
MWQGLPLVHFSAQPQPVLSQKLLETTQRIPQNSLFRAAKWTIVSPWYVASGGIGNGRQLAACLALGADGKASHSSTSQLNLSRFGH